MCEPVGAACLYTHTVWFFVRDRLGTHRIESLGKLKIPPEQDWDFTAEDLKDLGEIGRGAYGSVNKMVHKPSNQIMAVKVIQISRRRIKTPVCQWVVQLLVDKDKV